MIHYWAMTKDRIDQAAPNNATHVLRGPPLRPFPTLPLCNIITKSNYIYRIKTLQYRILPGFPT